MFAPVVVKLSSEHRLPKLSILPTFMHPSVWKANSLNFAPRGVLRSSFAWSSGPPPEALWVKLPYRGARWLPDDARPLAGVLETKERAPA